MKCTNGFCRECGCLLHLIRTFISFFLCVQECSVCCLLFNMCVLLFCSWWRAGQGCKVITNCHFIDASIVSEQCCIHICMQAAMCVLVFVLVAHVLLQQWNAQTVVADSVAGFLRCIRTFIYSFCASFCVLFLCCI